MFEGGGAAGARACAKAMAASGRLQPQWSAHQLPDGLTRSFLGYVAFHLTPRPLAHARNRGTSSMCPLLHRRRAWATRSRCTTTRTPASLAPNTTEATETSSPQPAGWLANMYRPDELLVPALGGRHGNHGQYAHHSQCDEPEKVLAAQRQWPFFFNAPQWRPSQHPRRPCTVRSATPGAWKPNSIVPA